MICGRSTSETFCRSRRAEGKSPGDYCWGKWFCWWGISCERINKMGNNSSKKPDQANNLMGYWAENQNESFDDLWAKYKRDILSKQES